MRYGLLLSAAALAMAATPALADVKAGVDAWAKGDFKAAIEQWRGPAIAGDPDAQFNLGQAYKLGRGVPVDPGLAESWFRKAALQGHEQAGDNYALALFQAGRKSDALPWLEKSVARGEPRCQLVLGTMLFNGDGVARDYPRAYALMTRASAAGLPSASQTLAQMDQYITPADRERGTVLAQQYATQPPPGIRTAALPPSRLPEPKPTPAPKPKPTPVVATRPMPARPPLVAVTKPVPTKALPGAKATLSRVDLAVDKPAPMRVGAGGWSAQLGAFRDRRNAEGLWTKMKARFPGGQAFYAEANGVIRVQASGYATKAAAQAACAKAGVSCVIVAP